MQLEFQAKETKKRNCGQLRPWAWRPKQPQARGGGGGAFSVSRRGEKKTTTAQRWPRRRRWWREECARLCGRKGSIKWARRGEKKLLPFPSQKARAASHPLLENLVTLSALERERERARARVRLCAHLSRRYCWLDGPGCSDSPPLSISGFYLCLCAPLTYSFERSPCE